MRLTILAVALLGLMSSQGAFAAKRTRAPLETVNAIYVQCPNQWLREHVGDVLQDRCACVSSNPSEADSTLDVTYTDTPGTIAPLRDVKVSAKLLQNQTVLWHEQSDWPVAGTPSMTPKQAALGLSTGLVLELQESVRLGNARDITQRDLQVASRISIVPHFTGDYDWNTVRTGMQIGEWEMRKDNLKKVEKILGCK